MIQSTSGSPWDLVMGWVCLVWLVRALWGRFRAARKPGKVVWIGGWYFECYCRLVYQRWYSRDKRVARTSDSW